MLTSKMIKEAALAAGADMCGIAIKKLMLSKRNTHKSIMDLLILIQLKVD